METLVLEGKTYVKASKAAQSSGYTSDYVGQLCRGGKVDAHLVGRSWYVNIDDLDSHRAEFKRASRVKAREQVRKTLEERKKEEIESKAKHYASHATYERDETELMPGVRKLHPVVSPEAPRKRKIASHEEKIEKEPKYTIENEGDKILMSGDLVLVDATDEEFAGDDTVHLESHIMRKSKSAKSQHSIQKKSFDGTGKSPEITSKYKGISGTVSEIPIAYENTNFLAKLVELDVKDDGREEEVIETPKDTVDAENDGDSVISKERSRLTFLVPMVLFVCFVVVGAALLLKSTWWYIGTPDSRDGTTFESHVRFDYSSLQEKVLEKL